MNRRQMCEAHKNILLLLYIFREIHEY